MHIANQVSLIGNLGGDPILHYSKNDKAYLRINLAINSYRRDPRTQERITDTTWVPITLFGKSAENFEKVATKGCKVACFGHLTINRWTDKYDQNRRDMAVVVETFEVLTRPDKGRAPITRDPSVPKPSRRSPEDLHAERAASDDLPF